MFYWNKLSRNGVAKHFTVDVVVLVISVVKRLKWTLIEYSYV